MTREGNLTIVLLIVLIAIALSFAGGGFYLYQKERTRNTALQEELDDIKTRQKISEKKLEESQNTISTLGLKLEDAKTQISNLNTELQQEKVTKQEALTKIEQLKTDLEQQKQLRTDLEKKFNQAQKDVDKIQTQLKELNAKKTELEIKIEDLEAQSQAQGVELGKIIVGSEATKAAEVKTAAPKLPAFKLAQEVPVKTAVASGVEGKVLVVNKDYDFVVINLGSKDAVQIGNVFSIYHSNSYLGDVKIEKVHDSMAAAGFMSSDIKGKVSEGDKVVRKAK